MSTRMRRWFAAALVVTAMLTLGAVGVAAENTVASSTMIFEGALTPDGGGGYDGTVAMIDEAAASLGDLEAGFDVYARNGAMATYQDGSPYACGVVAEHDAYTTGGGWGTFFDPDCADWEHYQLTLSGDTWALEYATGGTTYAAPMSGEVDWGAMYAIENGAGVYYEDPPGTPVGTAADPGYALDNPCTGKQDGAGAWDMDWSWGSEYVPLEYLGFDVAVEDLGGGNYRVTLTPADPVGPFNHPGYVYTMLNAGPAGGYGGRWADYSAAAGKMLWRESGYTTYLADYDALTGKLSNIQPLGDVGHEIYEAQFTPSGNYIYYQDVSVDNPLAVNGTTLHGYPCYKYDVALGTYTKVFDLSTFDPAYIEALTSYSTENDFGFYMGQGGSDTEILLSFRGDTGNMNVALFDTVGQTFTQLTDTDPEAEYDAQYLGSDTSKMVFWTERIPNSSDRRVAILEGGSETELELALLPDVVYWPRWYRDHEHVIATKGYYDGVGYWNHTDLVMYTYSGGSWSAAEDMTGTGWSADDGFMYTGNSVPNGFFFGVSGSAAMDGLWLAREVPDEVWVDDDYTSDDAGGHSWGYDAFATIQEGVDACNEGGTVNVAAGTYVETVTIIKSLTVLGATNGISKNGYAVPAGYAWDDSVESIIQHPDPAGGYITIVDIEDVDNVTFDGFVVQELNAVADQNSSLVRVYAHTREITNISVSNNIIGPNTNTTLQDGAQGRMGLYIVNHPYSDLNGVVHSTFAQNKIFDTQGNGNCVFIWSSYFAYGAPDVASMAGTVIENNEIYGSRRSGIESAGGYRDLTIRGNTIYDCSSTNGGPSDDKLKYGHGILLIRGASDKMGGFASAYGPENLTIEDNEIYGNEKSAIYMGPMNKDYAITGNVLRDNGYCGIMLDLEGRHWNGTYEPPPSPPDMYAVYDGSSNLVANDNEIYGNALYGVQVVGVPTNGFVFDAKFNWWGDGSGPGPVGPGGGDNVSDNVDYAPWLGSADGMLVMVPAGTSLADIQAAIDNAPYGATIVLMAGSHPGGINLSTPGITIIGEPGTIIGAGSPAFTVTAADIIIQGMVLDGDGVSEGIVLLAGADNLTVQDCELRNWFVGVEIRVSVTSFKMVGNWIHNNTIGFRVWSGTTLGGVVTIEGNLFKANTSQAVAVSTQPVDCRYNSWGSYAGPPVGSITGNVLFDPWTYTEVFMDMAPDTEATTVTVNESDTFDVALKIDAKELIGLSFKLNYDTDWLTLNSTTWAVPFDGKQADLDPAPVAGQENYRVTLTAPVDGDGMTVVTFNFTAEDNAGASGSGPWDQYFDIGHVEAETSAGAPGGVKIYVNNAGYGDASIPARDITDGDDGKVVIKGIANYAGFVDLQGRTNDAGATVSVSQASVAKASGTTVPDGSYTTAHLGGQLLVLGETYDLLVDAPLFLSAEATGIVLDVRPLDALAQCKLLGGDADDSDNIDISDVSIIGGEYGKTSGFVVGADVNIDGQIDILDLVLAAGNYGLSSSPWTVS